MNKKVAITVAIIFLVIVSALALFLNSKSRTDLPEDFNLIKRDMDKGILLGLCDLDEKYWGIPEFYPTYEKNKNIPHDFSRWGVTGFGAYPSMISYSVSNMKPGDKIEVCTYVHTGWNIETFQGLKLGIDYNNDIFDVNITPDEILLSPTFPQTIKGWTNKVKIMIVAKENVTADTYNFQLKGEQPSPEKGKEYYNQVMSMKDFPFYTCSFWDTKCKDEIVELRKKTYYSAGTFQADKFFNIEVVVK